MCLQNKEIEISTGKQSALSSPSLIKPVLEHLFRSASSDECYSRIKK